MTLKHHESVSAVLPPDILLSFDIIEVERVISLAEKQTWKLETDPWNISDDTQKWHQSWFNVYFTDIS